MSLGKVARKLKRVGKTAFQFRFTSTFEYIELSCNGTWRPENLRIIWLRNHRRVQSIDVKWTPTEDRGPNGAVGKGTFDPAFSVALIVTVYGDPSSEEVKFEEKEYKYYIESDGPSGKKIVASFNIDIAEYASMKSSKHTLDMSFKPVSKKIDKAVLGITLQSEFMKQGNAIDDDMQSTFSAVSAGQDSLQFDEEEEEGSLTPTDTPTEKEAQKKAVMKSHSQQTTPQATPQKSGRRVVASKEDWTPPPNHLYEDIPEGEESTEAPPIVSPLDAWLGEAQFIDCFGESVSREKLEGAEIIGLYFSANWCPPCRRFLPKLVKFYHNLKQNQKSFEMLYISSDYSRQEMTKYMQEQQMPWLALAFDSTISDKLRVDYNVAAIPILTIVSKTGAKLEERARKAVEQASSISSVLKLYGKWVERTQQLGQPTAAATGQAADHQPVEGEEKKGGILKTLKSAIHKPGSEVPLGRSPGAVETQKSVGDTSDSESGGVRVTVEQRSRSRTKQKSKEGGGPTAEEMEEKEERLRHLEEVNMSLKQTNDDLNEEVAELKKQIGEFQAKLTMLEKSSKKLEDEKRELMANLNIRGWLLKKGLKGPTANRWRRRYFRCDQGSKIYYYKSASEGTPQGFIDLDLVVSVQEISPAQQDKNHATFLVQCEGRTFQLQAHDETTMRKWMSAIEYLKNWRQRNAHSISGH